MSLFSSDISTYVLIKSALNESSLLIMYTSILQFTCIFITSIFVVVTSTSALCIRHCVCVWCFCVCVSLSLSLSLSLSCRFVSSLPLTDFQFTVSLSHDVPLATGLGDCVYVLGNVQRTGEKLLLQYSTKQGLVAQPRWVIGFNTGIHCGFLDDSNGSKKCHSLTDSLTHSLSLSLSISLFLKMGASVSYSQGRSTNMLSGVSESHLDLF